MSGLVYNSLKNVSNVLKCPPLSLITCCKVRSREGVQVVKTEALISIHCLEVSRCTGNLLALQPVGTIASNITCSIIEEKSGTIKKGDERVDQILVIHLIRVFGISYVLQ